MVALLPAFRRRAPRRAYLVMTESGLAVHTVSADAPPPALAVNTLYHQPADDKITMTMAPGFTMPPPAPPIKQAAPLDPAADATGDTLSP